MKLSKALSLSQENQMNGNGCAKHQHTVGAQEQFPAPCLSPLGSVLAPSLGGPKALTDNFSPEHHPDVAHLHTVGSALTNPTSPEPATLTSKPGAPGGPMGPSSP